MKIILVKIYNKFRILFKKKNKIQQLNNYSDVSNKSRIEIYAALRHETHRIEKAVYNGLIKTKYNEYYSKSLKVIELQNVLLLKNPDEIKNPVFIWSKKIIDNFNLLNDKFVIPNSTIPLSFDEYNGQKFIEMVKRRRSSRVWDEGFTYDKLLEFIPSFIEAAIWAPNSGNRQAIRIRPIYKQEEKELLIGLKEKHCYSAPLLFFVGIDSRLYGALSNFEECMYIDASAGITQMILFAESMNLGSCWNHFGLDMINSRQSNVEQYNVLTKKLNIPNYILPIAIISVGKHAYITPAPERMPLEDFVF
jgi:nitroreductase